MKGIKKAVKRLRLYVKTVWKAKSDYKIPISARIKYALKGFTVNEYVWYRLDKNDYKDYISEYERLKSRDINGSYKFILDDKVIFEEVVGKYVTVPKNYAWMNNGIIYGLHNEDICEENVISKLREYGKTVLKWNGSGGGQGTYVIECAGDIILLNGVQTSEEDIIKLFKRKGNAILCKYMEQSGFSAELYDKATNTIRMVCAKKKGDARSQLVVAVQRIGTDDSAPVDNVSMGGFTCMINTETGELGHAYAKYGRMENRMIPFDEHPDTGKQIRGKVIPNWNEIVEQVLALSNELPYLNFVAWDILLTKDGFCVIEGNASSGCGMFQMEKGIKNTSMGEIYRSYGVI